MYIFDDIFEYLEYANNLGIKIVLISNGYNLNEEKIKRLSNLNIVAFFFSIDSCKKEIHDSLRGIKGLFEKATENINILKKYMPNTKVVLNHVINSKNISDFLEFIKMKERVNFDYINPIIIKDCERLFPSKSQIENYKKNIELFKDTAKYYDIEFLCQDIDFFKSDVQDNGDREYNTLARCVYPSFCSFIDCPTGLVYPCDCSIHRDRELYCIGSLHDNTFKEIWNGEKRKNLKKLLYRGMLDCPLKCDEANCLFNKNYFKKEVNNEEDISNC